MNPPSPNYGRWLYALVVMLALIAGLYLSTWAYGLLRAGSNILGLYFTAWLLQFFFTPVVDYLTRHRIPRLLAVCYVYLVLALVIVVLAVWTVPGIYSQGQRLAGELGNTRTYAPISTFAQGVERFLEQHGVPRKEISDFTQSYSINLRNGAFNVGVALQKIIRDHLTPSNISNSASTFLAFLNTIGSLLVNVVIVLILAFYMTLDGHRLARRALGYFPPVVAEVARSVNGIVNRKFGGYLRGQIILAATYGVLTYAIAAAFGLQYEIFIAIFAAVMMLIPFVGTYAAIIPPLVGFVLVHVTDPSFPLGSFLLLLAFLIGSQQVVINFLAPRVMGTAVGMHPLLVVLGLLLGIQVAGLWGAIFGVPVFAVVVETADVVYRRVMERRFGFHPAVTAELDGGQGPSRGADAGSGGAPGGEAERPPTPVTAPLPRAGAALQPPRPEQSVGSRQ